METKQNGKPQLGGMIYGNSFNGESCQIVVLSTQLAFYIDEQRVGNLNFNSIKISATGTNDKYLKFESTQDGDALNVLTGDKSIVDAIKAKGASMHFLSQLEGAVSTRKKRAVGRITILLGLVAFVVLCIGGMFAALHPAAQMMTAHIPPEWEVELGRSEATKILQNNQTCTDEALNSAVNEIGRRLVVGMGKTPYQWHIKVIDNEEVNAFTLPGGYVFIHRGLIEASDSADEVAGVLAHEFQHVLQRHGMKNVVANLGLRLVLFAVIGDMEAVQGFLLENMASLATMQFSRDQETEADMGAVELAYKSNINPQGFLQFMKKLEDKENPLGAVLTIVSTHPGSADRMEDISAMIAKKGNGPIDAFSADWTAIKKKCSPAAITTPDSLDF